MKTNKMFNERQIRDIRHYCKNKVKQSIIAKRMSVSPSTISRIVNKKTYK